MKTQRKGPITRDSILGTINEKLETIDSWKEGESWHYVLQYHNQAEALIELLEVSDCGSVGGYAKGQTEAHRRTLRARFNWLKGERT